MDLKNGSVAVPGDANRKFLFLACVQCMPPEKSVLGMS